VGHQIPSLEGVTRQGIFPGKVNMRGLSPTHLHRGHLFTTTIIDSLDNKNFDNTE
jgi:hypothetical protein